MATPVSAPASAPTHPDARWRPLRPSLGGRPLVAGIALVVVCLALAALTLLAPSAPSYDPFAWIVWGRELVTPGATFSVSGGPSWKPLPVLFTAVFSFAGAAAPGLWLVVARAGALTALAGSFRLGERLAGRWAGALAAVAVLLLQDFTSLAWRGASEPLLLACLVWAIERHMDGRRGTAFALGVAAALIRPEVMPFLGVYTLVCWRRAGTRERLLLVGGLVLVPLLWLGVPAVGGDALAASSTATSDAATAQSASAPTALWRGLALPLVAVWVLAGAAAVLRPRDRAISVLGSGAVAWLALVVAMTAAGYSGVGRYMLPAAAVACVLAAVGTVDLVPRIARQPRWRVAVAAVIAIVCAGTVAERALTIDDQIRDGIRVGQAREDLREAIAATGGAAALRRCAFGGQVAINHTEQTTLAWELDVPLDRVALRLSRPGILVRARRTAAVGAPPPVVLPAPRRQTLLARTGEWRIETVSSVGAPLPRACRAGVRSRAQNQIP